MKVGGRPEPSEQADAAVHRWASSSSRRLGSVIKAFALWESGPPDGLGSRIIPLTHNLPTPDLDSICKMPPQCPLD